MSETTKELRWWQYLDAQGRVRDLYTGEVDESDPAACPMPLCGGQAVATRRERNGRTMLDRTCQSCGGRWTTHLEARP